MATKTLITPMDGTPQQMVFADHATDFSPTAANDLRITSDGSNETDVQMDTTDLAAAGSARQSAKCDLGANWAEEYKLRGAIEFASGVVAGEVVECYWAPSSNSTAGTGNPGGASGADAAYTGTAGSTVAESVKQLDYIGSFIATDDSTTVVQIAEIGVLCPQERYGSLVVVNQTTGAFHSDAVETHFVLDPVVAEAQN